MKAIKSMLANLETPKQPAAVPLASAPEVGEESDSLDKPSETASSKDILSQGTSSPRYRLSLEEVDALLGEIYETLEIKEEQTSLSQHDQMYQTVKEDQNRIFLVHSALVDSIKEWNRRKNIFFLKSEEEIPFQ